MPRMRSIKPEFWADQDLTCLRRDLRLLYIALWNFTDEQARMQGDPRLVKSWCFPLDDDLTAVEIDGWLDELEAAGKVLRYQVDGYRYLYLPKLPKHQKLDARLDSRLPAPPDPIPSQVNTDQSGRTRVENTDQPGTEVAKHVAGSREHVAGSMGQGGARGARLPDDWTPDPDLIAWQRGEQIPDDVARRELPRFRDYWTAQPGAKGRKSDWPATWRNWLRRACEQAPTGRASPRSTADTRAADALALAQRLRIEETG